jgi:hypothetical protein
MTFVGRVALAAGAGSCCIVAGQEPAAAWPGEPAPSSEDELRQLRKWAVNGVLATAVIGELSDGGIALIDLRADPGVVATIDSALS